MFILPDVFRDEQQTHYIPFCGRAMPVMLGTATMARKTGARIVPAVATPSGNGMAFATRILESVPGLSPASSGDKLSDYIVTMALFAAFETAMENQLVYWQNFRAHHLTCPPLQEMSKRDVDATASLMLRDPDLLPPIYVSPASFPDGA